MATIVAQQLFEAHVGVTARPFRFVIVATEDWYVVSHRLAFVAEAVRQGHDVTVITRVRAHAEQIRAVGATVISIDWSREEPAWRIVGHVARLRAVLRQIAPDSVLLVAMKPILGGVPATLGLGIPRRVMAVSGLGLLFYGRSLKWRAIRPALKVVLSWMLRQPGATALVQNADDAHLVRALRRRSDGVTLVPGVGVDLSTFRPREEAAGAPIVMLPARLLRAKGVLEFASAARLLRERGVSVRMVLVGAPDEGSRDAVSAADIGAWCDAGDVEWWGHRTDMATTLSEAHVVCLPSWGEGMPRVLLEAAASARPVITTDAPGCREAIVDGVTGLLVPVRDAAALADAIARLAEDAGLRHTMGTAARRRAEVVFDQHRSARDMLAACVPEAA